jgi:hypothetical protein
VTCGVARRLSAATMRLIYMKPLSAYGGCTGLIRPSLSAPWKIIFPNGLKINFVPPT